MALRWRASIDHFASFRFADPAAAPRAARTLKGLAERLREGLAFDGAEIGEPFGDEALAMFTIAFGTSLFGGYEINVGVSPDGGTSNTAWSLHVQTPQAGMLERSWRPKLEMMKVVERRLHGRLLDLGALDLRWRVLERRDDPGQAAP